MRPLAAEDQTTEEISSVERAQSNKKTDLEAR